MTDREQERAAVPKFAKVGRVERWLQRRREHRMMKAYGGIQWCPWCKQCAQQDNAEWNFNPSDAEPFFDVLTCGVCSGTSLWYFGMGMHYQRPLNHPAIERGDHLTDRPAP